MRPPLQGCMSAEGAQVMAACGVSRSGAFTNPRQRAAPQLQGRSFSLQNLRVRRCHAWFGTTHAYSICGFMLLNLIQLVVSAAAHTQGWRQESPQSMQQTRYNRRLPSAAVKRTAGVEDVKTRSHL